jgi:cytochrome c1
VSRAALGVAAAVLLAGCGGGSGAPALGGDPEHGRLLLRQYGCGTCHRIPGVAAARGDVGPPLDAIARRVYLAGIVPNTPQGMAAWIRDPQAFDPRTAMPDMQVTEAHARDMVAYLYGLE